MEELFNLYLHVFVSLFIGILYFKIIRYDFFSVRGIVTVYFFIFYPFVALLNLSLTYFSDIKIDDLYVILSLMTYEIFISSMLIVELFLRKRRVSVQEYNVRLNTNRLFVLLLIYVLALLLRLWLGVYYHISIEPDYNFNTASFQNLLDKLHWIGVIPAFAFWYKYQQTNRRVYFFAVIFIASLSVIIYLPSGSRTTAFGFIPLLLIYIVSSMKSKKKAVIFIGSSCLLLSSLIIYSGKIRVVDNDFENSNLSDDAGILIHRLSDYLMTGRIIEKVPASYDYRYLKNIEYSLHGVFPAFLRSKLGMQVDFNDGAEYAYKIGLTQWWTSVPITILGDFYSRLGWSGVVVLSLLLAIVIKLYDNLIIGVSSLYRLIFLVLFGRYLSQIYIVDLQVLFLTLTREFIVAFLLSTIIYRFIKKKYSGNQLSTMPSTVLHGQ